MSASYLLPDYIRVKDVRVRDPHDLERQNGTTLRGISLRHGQRLRYQAAEALALAFKGFGGCIVNTINELACSGLEAYITTCRLHICILVQKDMNIYTFLTNFSTGLF